MCEYCCNPALDSNLSLRPCVARNMLSRVEIRTTMDQGGWYDELSSFPFFAPEGWLTPLLLRYGTSLLVGGWCGVRSDMYVMQ